MMDLGLSDLSQACLGPETFSLFLTSHAQQYSSFSALWAEDKYSSEAALLSVAATVCDKYQARLYFCVLSLTFPLLLLSACWLLGASDAPSPLGLLLLFVRPSLVINY